MTISRRPPGLDSQEVKKHDDYRAPQSVLSRSRWRLPRRRRLFLVVIALYLLYIFFKNMPTDLRPAAERYDLRIAELRKQQSKSVAKYLFENAPPPSTNNVGDANELRYDGTVNFPFLDSSLRRSRLYSNTPSGINGNLKPGVLFAASNLRCVSDLIPMACEMGRTKGNAVHFAVMGRDPVSLEGIKHVNGVNDDDCPIFWHDARTDYAPWSTNQRMQIAVMGALERIRSTVNIQVVITQRKVLEDNFFSEAAGYFSDKKRITLIKLSASATDLLWLAKLDTEALSAWNKISIEILIRSSKEPSASLFRLLKSLRNADYLDTKPSLTIELPSRPDPKLLHYLQILKESDWAERISIQGRINSSPLTPQESALRTAESYFPLDSSSSSILVLSPQVELSPSFFHFLKYAILKYKHSEIETYFAYQLVGISLEFPSMILSGDKSLSIPSSMAHDTLSLWQSPNSNAALYFGDKWDEFQNFLYRRTAPHDSNSVGLPQFVSEKYPAFIHYLFELMRAQGYYMLYPLAPTAHDLRLATLHNELFEPPEEFRLPKSGSLRKEIDEHYIDDVSHEDIWSSGSTEKSVDKDSTLGKLLSRSPEGLPRLSSLPLLSYDGQVSNYEKLHQDSIEYGNSFRTKYGGCKTSEVGDAPLREPGIIDNLFCTVEL